MSFALPLPTPERSYTTRTLAPGVVEVRRNSGHPRPTGGNRRERLRCFRILLSASIF